MSISRRRFLGWLGAAGVGTAVGTSADAASNRHFTGYPNSFGVLHDISLCVGCRSCEAACNKVNELPPPKLPFTEKSVLDKNGEPRPKPIPLSTNLMSKKALYLSKSSAITALSRHVPQPVL